MDNHLNKPMFPAPQVSQDMQSQVPQRQCANPYGAEYNDDIDMVRDFWRRLLKRKKWILGIFIFAVAGTGLYLLLTKPVYRSSATIQIMQNNKSDSMLGDT